MRLDAKLAVLNAINELMHAGEIGRLGDFVADGFVMHEDPGMPYGGTYLGPAGFVEMVGKVVATWRNLRTETLAVLDEPGASGVLMKMRLTGDAPGGGEPIVGYTSEFWRIEDGKLTEWRVWYYDTPTLSARLAG